MILAFCVHASFRYSTPLYTAVHRQTRKMNELYVVPVAIVYGALGIVVGIAVGYLLHDELRDARMYPAQNMHSRFGWHMLQYRLQRIMKSLASFWCSRKILAIDTKHVEAADSCREEIALAGNKSERIIWGEQRAE